MADIGFYHLTRDTVVDAAPRLLAKAYGSGARVLVRANTTERLDALDRMLWSFDASSFIPHGLDRNEHNSLQPILLSTSEHAANGARWLMVVDNALPASLEPFERCFYLFEATDPDQLAQARMHWTSLRGGSHSLTYWKQGERGWEQGARG